MSKPATPIVLTVVVNRKRWLRGEGDSRSSLLRTSDNKMCCLGFACLAAGHTEEEIADINTPGGLWTQRGIDPTLPGYEDLIVLNNVMKVNDAEVYDDEYREEYISRELATIGIAMTFDDGPDDQMSDTDPG